VVRLYYSTVWRTGQLVVDIKTVVGMHSLLHRSLAAVFQVHGEYHPLPPISSKCKVVITGSKKTNKYGVMFVP